jgi:hypothetical protein
MITKFKIFEYYDTSTGNALDYDVGEPNVPETTTSLV